MDRNRIVLASMAALVAAMLGRIGWVNWPAVASVTLIICVGQVLLVAAMAVLCAPILLLAWLAAALVSFLTEGPDRLGVEAGPHGAATARVRPLGRKAFFFEKKKQKTFIHLAAAFPESTSPDS